MTRIMDNSEKELLNRVVKDIEKEYKKQIFHEPYPDMPMRNALCIVLMKYRKEEEEKIKEVYRKIYGG